MITPARRAAYQVLLRVFEDDAYADRASRGAAAGLDERERASMEHHTFETWQILRRITLPLSGAALFGATIFVFFLSAGDYITPVFLGGTRSSGTFERSTSSVDGSVT